MTEDTTTEPRTADMDISPEHFSLRAHLRLAINAAERVQRAAIEAAEGDLCLDIAEAAAMLTGSLRSLEMR